MPRLSHYSMQITATLLVASVALIMPGVVGLGASLGLGISLVTFSILLFLAHSKIDVTVQFGNYRIEDIIHVVPAGTLGAGLLVLLSLGASAGELQAYGGICGLVGMLNYFLRPVYGLVYTVGRYVARAFARADRP